MSSKLPPLGNGPIISIKGPAELPLGRSSQTKYKKTKSSQAAAAAAALLGKSSRRSSLSGRANPPIRQHPSLSKPLSVAGSRAGSRTASRAASRANSRPSSRAASRANSRPSSQVASRNCSRQGSRLGSRRSSFDNGLATVADGKLISGRGNFSIIDAARAETKLIDNTQSHRSKQSSRIGSRRSSMDGLHGGLTAKELALFKGGGELVVPVEDRLLKRAPLQGMPSSFLDSKVFGEGFISGFHRPLTDIELKAQSKSLGMKWEKLKASDIPASLGLNNKEHVLDGDATILSALQELKNEDLCIQRPLAVYDYRQKSFLGLLSFLDVSHIATLRLGEDVEQFKADKDGVPSFLSKDSRESSLIEKVEHSFKTQEKAGRYFQDKTFSLTDCGTACHVADLSRQSAFHAVDPSLPFLEVLAKLSAQPDIKRLVLLRGEQKQCSDNNFLSVVTQLDVLAFLARTKISDLGAVAESTLHNLGLLDFASSNHLSTSSASGLMLKFMNWETATVLDVLCRMQQTQEAIIALRDEAGELKDFITANDLLVIFETRDLGALFCLAKDFLAPLRQKVVEYVEETQQSKEETDRDRNIIYQAQLHRLRKGNRRNLPSEKAKESPQLALPKPDVPRFRNRNNDTTRTTKMDDSFLSHEALVKKLPRKPPLPGFKMSSGTKGVVARDITKDLKHLAAIDAILRTDGKRSKPTRVGSRAGSRRGAKPLLFSFGLLRRPPVYCVAGSVEGAALASFVSKAPLNGHALIVHCYTFPRSATIKEVLLQMVEAQVDRLWEVASPTSPIVTGAITAAQILRFFNPASAPRTSEQQFSLP